MLNIVNNNFRHTLFTKLILISSTIIYLTTSTAISIEFIISYNILLDIDYIIFFNFSISYIIFQLYITKLVVTHLLFFNIYLSPIINFFPFLLFISNLPANLLYRSLGSLRKLIHLYNIYRFIHFYR